MKLLGVRLARSIWLAPQQFFNSKGAFLREASFAIKERYQFHKTPYENNTAGTGEAKYESGGFKTKSDWIGIHTLTFHTDGIVADTQASTDKSDAFIEDLLNWLHKEYGTTAPSVVPIRRLYVSELNVSFDGNEPEFLNPKLRPFREALAEAMGETGFVGFQIGNDQEKLAKPGIFRLEREINTSLAGNRFYSFAPLQTRVHLKLLETLAVAVQ